MKKSKETPDTAYVKNISIEDNSDPKSSSYIFAERGKIFLNRRTGMLHLLLFDGEMHELDISNMEEYRTVQFPKQLQTIAVPEMILRRSDKGSRGDREKSAQMMQAEIKEYRARIQDHENKQTRLIQNYFQTMLPQTSNPSSEDDSAIFTREKIFQTHQQLLHQLQSMQNTRNIGHMRKEISKLSVEVQKKYSIPVACIVFILVGAPLGIMARRGNMAVAGGIAFAFFLLYWSTLIGGEELADHQYITPFMAMWSANIICGIGGFYLIFHSIHEITFFNWSKFSDFFKNLNFFSRTGA
ncbi:MAG: LptF/LptG family permease [candidate division KSB1 bacterium]|nr:LptF/LptG family permease [candidate division KSB1 bacterium]